MREVRGCQSRCRSGEVTMNTPSKDKPSARQPWVIDPAQLAEVIQILRDAGALEDVLSGIPGQTAAEGKQP